MISSRFLSFLYGIVFISSQVLGMSFVERINEAVESRKSVYFMLEPGITLDQAKETTQKLLSKEQLQQIEAELNEESLIDVLCEKEPQDVYGYCKLFIALKKEKTLTPTLTHFFYHLHAIHSNYDGQHLSLLAQIKPLIVDIVQKEQEIYQQGNYSFVHGTRANIIFAMDMYTQGWFIKKNKTTMDHFLFLRFPNLNKSMENNFVSDIKHRIIKGISDKFVLCFGIPVTRYDSLNLIISESIQFYRRLFDFVQPKLVFFNGPLFGNMSQYGAHTIYYFWNNYNWVNNPWILDDSWQFVSERLGMQSYFYKYGHEFVELQKLHSQLANEKGVILQFECTPHAIKKFFHLAAPGGYNKQIMIGKKRTRDVAYVLDTMRTNIMAMDEPDVLEFCCVTAHLWPTEEIKIYRHYYGDKALVQEYYKRRDALFAKIKADYSENI